MKKNTIKIKFKNKPFILTTSIFLAMLTMKINQMTN